MGPRTSSLSPAHRRPRRRSRPARSVAGVPLFPPRISVHVIAVGLPEAGLVLVEELEAAHPLGALPEIQMRDEQPRRAAVLGIERLAVIAERQPGTPAGDVVDREVGAVATVAEGKHECRLGCGLLEQRVDRYGLPLGVELGPPGHAMNVGRDGLGGQRAHLLPGPRLNHLAGLADGERPRLGGNVRRRASRQDGKVMGYVLPWRHPPWRGCLLTAPTVKAA